MRSCASPRRTSFNPRAREGRDFRLDGDGTKHTGFNPRAREGRDYCRKHGIHAGWQGFNPRAREGRDRCWRWRTRWTPSFNPRAREGRDPTCCAASTADRGFNPRAREGRDLRRGRIAFRIPVSIHAPVKGATDGSGPRCGSVQVSIHAPVKGATRGLRIGRTLAVFQSTRP